MSSTEKPTETTSPMPTSSSDKVGDVKPEAAFNEPSTVTTKSNVPPQLYTSNVQNIFSGLPNTGLMCNNLRPNPFSVTDAASSNSGILAKPKFSLKPSSFGGGVTGTGDQSHVAANTTSSTTTSTNPFLRPAKLNYDNEDDNSDGKQVCGVEPEKDAEQQAASSDSRKTNSDKTAEISSSTDVESNDVINSSEPGSSTQPPILTPALTTLSSNVFRAPQSSFVFGEALDSRVTNVTKENGTNGHSDPDEAQKPKTLTLEEAADEYKKQQV